MSFPSVDKLQKTLTSEVFHYAKDAKKAAGRALGTLVEIITYHTLRSWGLRDGLSIERPIPEFGNPEITHNVEYSLHPILRREKIEMEACELPVTAGKIRAALGGGLPLAGGGGTLLSKDRILRYCCKISEAERTIHTAHLDGYAGGKCMASISRLHSHPFAIFECKRVGVEEGMRKGPQTIEKAKQGAYVARVASSLQKVRLSDGQLGGIIATERGGIICKPHHQLLREVIHSDSADLLRGFTLTVGVVSNHGNWFTAENPNKELKVLAQSYDWLLFLTDRGLSDFISELLLAPSRDLKPAREAFLSSYAAGKKKNRFTKVQMDIDADRVLQAYFEQHRKRVETWFNVLAPKKGSLAELRSELSALQGKDWRQILGI